jgi:predicted ribosome quality control (RQC) complex YloA/Tae2 family protein
MSLSINEFRLLAERIQTTLAGAKVTRILEPAPGCVTLAFDSAVPLRILVIAANPKCPTVFLAKAEPPVIEAKQPQPILNASFPKALDHTLRGFTLSSAGLLRPGDRVLRLEFRNTDKYGVEKVRRLQVELTGRVTQVFVLTEADLVVSSMRRLMRPGTLDFKTAARQIAAGKLLPPPPMPPADAQMGDDSPVLDEVLERECTAFAEFQDGLRGAAPKKGDSSAKQKTEALQRELELARQAGRALAVLGPFMLAPAGIRQILADNGCVKLADMLGERGYLDVPIDYNRLIQYLQRISGNAPSLAKLAGKAADAPAPVKRERTKESVADAVSTKLKLFPYRAKRLRTMGGFDLIVTTSAEGNLAALKMFAAPENIWFHARDFAGGYVIMLTGKRAPDPHDIEQAAVVAAANSKGREESSVEVCYTQLKYLKKPKDAKTGTILRTKETVITVRPSAFAELRAELSSL